MTRIFVSKYLYAVGRGRVWHVHSRGTHWHWGNLFGAEIPEQLPLVLYRDWDRLATIVLAHALEQRQRRKQRRKP